MAEATTTEPAGRVVLIGLSPEVKNVDWVLDQVRNNVGQWCGDMKRAANGGDGLVPHAVMVLAAAHGLEPNALQSALRGGLIVLKPIGSEPSDEEWKLALDTFRKAGGEHRAG